MKGESRRGTGGVLYESFLVPALAKAQLYRRAVGYFSSRLFERASDPFVEFVRRGGAMELVCSPVVSPADAEAMREGVFESARWRRLTLEDLGRPSSARWCYRFLSWLLATGRLECAIAEVTDSRRAVFHEKFGVVFDGTAPQLAFEGSANETEPAYYRNFERIRLYHAQEAADRRCVARLATEFERLWLDRTRGLRVVPLLQAIRDGILRPRGPTPVESLWGESMPASNDSPPPETLRFPARLELRDYQRKAISDWFGAKGQGLLAMATGTGKTITALSAMVQLFDRVGPPLAIIIVAPYVHLVDQWCGEARRFGLAPLACYSTSADWRPAAEAALYSINVGDRPLLTLATTNATFSGDAFQHLLERLRCRTVLVADEVHHLGARQLRECLPQRVSLRLGLSATPTRWMDEDGSGAVRSYFGWPPVFEFSLRDALEHSPPVLTPYVYRPILVELDPDEAADYVRLSTAIAKFLSSAKDEDLSDSVLGLLLKRSRIVASAGNKIPALRQVLEPVRRTSYNLVYCGDGSVELEALGGTQSAPGSDPVERQIEAVIRMLGRDLGMNVAKFTAETPRERRTDLLREFAAGDRQALVAIRCLDEGVDVPGIRRAFILASSTNPGQLIQRRGRLLRRAEGKERAEIYDFVVVPPGHPADYEGGTGTTMRRLFERELSRVVDMLDLAQNRPQAYAELLPALQRWNLLHL